MVNILSESTKEKYFVPADFYLIYDDSILYKKAVYSINSGFPQTWGAIACRDCYRYWQYQWDLLMQKQNFYVFFMHILWAFYGHKSPTQIYQAKFLQQKCLVFAYTYVRRVINWDSLKMKMCHARDKNCLSKWVKFWQKCSWVSAAWEQSERVRWIISDRDSERLIRAFWHRQKVSDVKRQTAMSAMLTTPSVRTVCHRLLCSSEFFAATPKRQLR